jgi:hypothetical protein
VDDPSLLLWVIGQAQPSNLVQKCDAKDPCTTCILAKSASECVYNAEKCTQSVVDGVFAGVLPPAKLKLINSTSDPTLLVTDELSALQVFKVDRVPQGHLYEPRISPGTNLHLSVISSFLPPTISPEPWVPLSFQGGEKLQVQISDTAASDLDMGSCVFE